MDRTGADLTHYVRCRCGRYNHESLTVCPECGHRTGAQGRCDTPDAGAVPTPVPAPAPAKQPAKAVSGRKRWAPYRSQTEMLAVEYLRAKYGTATRRIEYEYRNVKLAEGTHYMPDDTLVERRDGTDREVAVWEVKHVKRDCRNSLATQRRVLRVAAERLAELGITLRLLLYDGAKWTEDDV